MFGPALSISAGKIISIIHMNNCSKQENIYHIQEIVEMLFYWYENYRLAVISVAGVAIIYTVLVSWSCCPSLVAYGIKYICILFRI